jgi:hypothetical protein
MSNIITLVSVAIIMIVIVGLILSLPVMWLWNACLVPAVSGLNEIGWLQAWGILILCGLLFKTHVTPKE